MVHHTGVLIHVCQFLSFLQVLEIEDNMSLLREEVSHDVELLMDEQVKQDERILTLELHSDQLDVEGLVTYLAPLWLCSREVDSVCLWGCVYFLH